MAGRGERWDRDRLFYERDSERDVGRGREVDRERDTIIEDDRYYMQGGRGRDRSDERHDRRFGGRGFEEDFIRERRVYEDEPRQERRREPEYERRVVIEKERDREYYNSPSPRRPAFLRRQSSLDTFDRRPLRQFQQREEYGPPARREDILREDYRAPAYVPIPLPKSRGLPPPRREGERYYEEIDVAEPDRYGDEEYRRYPERLREREIIRDRRRRSDTRSRSRETATTRTRTVRSSSRSSVTSSRSSKSGGTTIKSEYPKKGKTRIPARLVSPRAIIDLGYPFVEEDNVVIVQKALGQDNIDQLLRLSEDYKRSELEVLAARSPTGFVEERREEIFAPPPPGAGLSPILVPPPPPPVIIEAGPQIQTGATEVIEKTTVFRDISPSRSSSQSSHQHHHRHRSTTLEESGSIAIGPLAIATRTRSRSRGSRDIRAEIRALEKELHHRPKPEVVSDREIVRAERLPDGQLVVYEEQVDKVVTHSKPPRIEKDKKGRMSISVPRFR